MNKILMTENSIISNSIFKVSCHHYSELFSKNNFDVFYLSNPISPFHFLSRNSLKLTKLRYSIYKNNGVKINENLKEYVALTLLPIRNNFLFRTKFALNNSLKFTYPAIRKILENNNFLSVDTLFLSTLLYHELINIVKFKKLILRITDDTSGHKTNPSGLVEIEKKLINMADAVIVTAKNLYSKIKIQRKDNIHYIPNGVDFEHFYYNKKDATPEDLKEINGKKLIYIGAIDYWFNEKLIAEIAHKLSDIHIIIIGPPKIKLAEIKKYGNVHILGKKDYSELPTYLHHCDIGIIPFKRIKLVKSVSPIKLYEYMAAGLPVVSTEWNELRMLESPAYLADNSEKFIDCIKKAILQKDSLKKQCVEFAKQNSWVNRFKNILEIIKKNS